ncbi:MAG: T9SS type A sorting domain-containing protein [Bacteroidetes bacterium]|nr:T9SS type A sorting domain-containing protein [Bacteroidota bacterium]
MKLKLQITVLWIVLLSATYKAQELKHCGTDEAIKQLYTAHPELFQSFVDNETAYNTTAAAQKKLLSTTVYTIPVVFHVLHQNGPENISDAQIADGIAILNRDMRKLNADTINVTPKFRSLVSDIGVVFQLAKIDPQGNCTNGIDRIYTSKTNYGDDSAKVNPWPRDKYLNIWTAKALQQGWAGYAYYPSAATGSLSVHDGLMILSDYIGSIGTSSVLKSRTLTHEVGHWLDLAHPWNTTINISINVGLACGDDLINDTPITKGHTTCPNLLTPDCMITDFSAGVFTFNDVNTTSGAIDTGTLSADFDSLTVTPFQAVGLSPNSGQSGEFSFSGWPTGATDGETNYSNLTGSLDPARYYEVSIAPKPSSSMSITGLKFKVNRSLTGPRTYAIRSSADGFTSNLTATVSPANSNVNVNPGNVFFYANDATGMEAGSSISVSGASFTLKNTPVTFRIYSWNAEDSNGEFAIDDVSIMGSTGIIENIQNYMEYSYCCNMWTTGQKDRMRLAVESAISGRSNLWSAANLAATGVTAPSTTCAPVPDFFASRTRLCKGNNVTFTKNILNGTETSRLWTFEGGTPATSTVANPVVTYSAAGVYSVSLLAANSSGTNTAVKTQYIRVDNTAADVIYSGSYFEGFENPTILDYTWQSYDLDNNGHKWQYVAGAGTGGSNAAGMNAFQNYGQDLDVLMSPSYDFTSAQNQTFNFKVASASTTTVSSQIQDELKVFFSTNCGASWFQRAVYTGTALVNNPATTSAFIPDASTAWTLYSIPIISLFQTSNVLVKFQYKSSFASNNIYIDDINLSQTVGIVENNPTSEGFTIFPNPTSDKSAVTYHLTSDAAVGIQVIDVLGKTIYQKNSANQQPGDHTELISKQGLNLVNGIYFVTLQINNKKHVQKLIISE